MFFTHRSLYLLLEIQLTLFVHFCHTDHSRKPANNGAGSAKDQMVSASSKRKDFPVDHPSSRTERRWYFDGRKLSVTFGLSSQGHSLGDSLTQK